MPVRPLRPTADEQALIDALIVALDATEITRPPACLHGERHVRHHWPVCARIRCLVCEPTAMTRREWWATRSPA